jgi:hypothetical protein
VPFSARVAWAGATTNRAEAKRNKKKLRDRVFVLEDLPPDGKTFIGISLPPTMLSGWQLYIR